MLYGDGNCYQAGFGGYGYEGWGIRWIYALLVLIVIVLQFGKRDVPAIASTTCCDGGVVATTGGVVDNQTIDNSVLFIIVVFLLILCSGCWTGGYGNYGAAGFPGYGYY